MKQISKWRKCHREIFPEIFQDERNVIGKYFKKYFKMEEYLPKRNFKDGGNIYHRKIFQNWRKCHREIFQDTGNFIEKYFKMAELRKRNIQGQNSRSKKCHTEIFQNEGKVKKKYLKKYFKMEEMSQRNILGKIFQDRGNVTQKYFKIKEMSKRNILGNISYQPCFPKLWSSRTIFDEELPTPLSEAGN